MDFAPLKLQKQADKRLRGGHLWIYSNEIDVARTPLGGFNAGDIVLVEDAGGKALGLAALSPKNLICGRLLTRQTDINIDQKFFVKRLQQAAKLRERCYGSGCYRLCYGESDSLPGLVIDRFGDYFVIQTSTVFMDSAQSIIVAAIEAAFKPKGILFKNDNASREAEGLTLSVDLAFGQVPEKLIVAENGAECVFPVYAGQKTGWFYDHRDNRRYLQGLVKNKTVLDVFSYVGAWSVEALVAGAQEVSCIDSSELALDFAEDNAVRNGFANKLNAYQGNAADAMKALLEEKLKFDVVVMDPPAFIKKQKDKRKGLEAYHRYNQLALRLLKPEGVLVSASCSMHLSREDLLNIVRVAGRHIDRQMQVFYQGGQGADHPVLPAIRETDYLKAVFSYIAG